LSSSAGSLPSSASMSWSLRYLGGALSFQLWWQLFSFSSLGLNMGSLVFSSTFNPFARCWRDTFEYNLYTMATHFLPRNTDFGLPQVSRKTTSEPLLHLLHLQRYVDGPIACAWSQTCSVCPLVPKTYFYHSNYWMLGRRNHELRHDDNVSITHQKIKS